MAAGLKQNNTKPGDGVSWEDLFAIDAGGLTNATRSNFFVELKNLPNGMTIAVAYYKGTGALTLTEFADFPIGSEIHASAITSPTIYIHKTQTATPVIGDWFYIAGTVVS